MATTPMRQLLAIMADPAIRGSNAADTGLLVLSADLSRLIWANSAAAASFGLAAPGPQETMPDGLLGQLAGSRSLFARKGRATLLLRKAGGFRASVAAELARIAPELGETEGLALLTARQLRPAYDAAGRDAALLREAGPGAEGARLIPTDEIGSVIGDDDLQGAETIAGFAASDAGLAEIAAGASGGLIVARIAEDRLLVLPLVNAPVAREDAAARVGDAASADVTGADAGGPMADGVPSSDASPHEVSSPQDRSVPPGTPEVEEVSSEGTEASVAPPPQTARPVLRSNWGAALPLAGASAAGQDQGNADSDAQVSEHGTLADRAPDADSDEIAEPATLDAATTVAPEDALTSAPESAPMAAEEDAAPATPEDEAEPDLPAAPPSRTGTLQTTRRHSAWGGLASQGRADGESREEPTQDAKTSEPDREPTGTTAPTGAGAPTFAQPSEPSDAESDDAKASADGAGNEDRADVTAPDIRPATAADFLGAGRKAEEPAGDFSPQIGGDPVRFVWRVDSEGRFRSLSPEFAAAVGPVSAAILDRSVDEVAAAYRLDEDGALRRLFSRRETWSGRTVMWPLQATAKKVPVDLAALPIYARDRSFDGFRGFGVVRLADAEDDPEAIGLAPAAALERAASEAGASEAPAEDHPIPAFMHSIGAPTPPVSFGRRDPEQRPPADHLPAPDETAAEPQRARPGDKVIRLEERRRPQNGHLSQTEEAAFRAIGETLAQGSDPRDLVEAVRAASERIEAIEGERHSEPGEGQTSETKDQADAAPSPATSADGAVAAALDEAYGSLPLPILAQAGDDLVYANREFLDLTGHADVDELKAAGGLEALVQERREGDADFLRLRRANGQSVPIRARMQRATVAGTGCLILSFFATPRLAVMSRELIEAAEETGDAAIRGVFENPVLDLAADGIVLVDEAGLITAMSGAAQQLFDIPAGDVAGRAFLTLFAHESQKSLKPILDGEEEALRGAAPAGDGEAKWYARRDVIGRVAGGGFMALAVSLGRIAGSSGYCAVIHDISRWKRAEEIAEKARASAEASNLQKSTFLSEVASEIRDPVDAMIGFADLMGSESLGPVGNERYLEYLDDIKRSGHQVIDLVTILHDLARVETGRRELSFEAVSLAEIVTEVAAVMAPQANRQRVIVRTHLPSSVPPVVGDHDTIRQITTNLVADAIRATPPGGQLIVSIKHSADTGVSLRFRDSGVGLRQDEIENALRGPGAGHVASGAESGRLGLPLTRALAEANRAEFSIASTPGEGTLVEVRFPPARVLLD
ncbi:PAS domain-containing protein [Jiella endophytica]|uniref:histidine kinase n=1 Tax=Jiella endophytica TaxID=2558362 RepID=A0A4Y8RCX9_9HYPH|nr:ATP-binding protein [Jiella endophytica]TFF19885.1 PAS domain-containing protein [Jiella endophytica]